MTSRSTVPAPNFGPARLRWLGLARRAAMLAALVALPVPAASRAAEPVVVPPAGTTYNDLAVAWWQYALGQPAATNPLLDPAGATCATGQSGSVFFLTGSSDTKAVTRSACTVSKKKKLFFPLLNAFDVHTPGDG